MRWLDTCHGAIHDNESGMPSSTRIAVLVSSLSLSVSLLILTVAVLWKPELTPALSVVAGGLAAMSGGSYVAGRAWSGTRKSTEDGPNEYPPRR